MIAAKLRYLRSKINTGKPLSPHDVNLLDDAAGYISKLENDLAMYMGELDSVNGTLNKWELREIDENHD